MKGDVPAKVYELLREVVKGNIEDYSIDVHDPNTKGDGFLGDFFYASLKGKHSAEVYEVAVKQAFSDDSIRKNFQIREYYLNEIHFYTKVWPRFQKFQSEYHLKEPFNKIAKCFATSSDSGSECLVLENLKRKDFRTHQKNLPLDERYYELIFKEYGKFHGISFACKLLDPQTYSEISAGLRCNIGDIADIEEFAKVMDQMTEECIDYFQSEEETKVVEKYKPYLNHTAQILGENFKYKGDYSVITHGDCWSNNMMFKYNDSNEVIDVRLLDFQFANIGSPVSDLSYCLYSGAPKDVLNKLDYFLKLYHDSLLNTLEGFGCRSENVYPFEQLKKDWKKYSKSGFIMGLAIWRTKLTKAEDIIDIKDSKDIKEEDRGKIRQVYDVEICRKMSRDLILHMYENDFL